MMHIEAPFIIADFVELMAAVSSTAIVICHSPVMAHKVYLATPLPACRPESPRRFRFARSYSLQRLYGLPDKQSFQFKAECYRRQPLGFFSHLFAYDIIEHDTFKNRYSQERSPLKKLALRWPMIIFTSIKYASDVVDDDDDWMLGFSTRFRFTLSHFKPHSRLVILSHALFMH